MEDMIHQVFSLACGQNSSHTWAPGGEVLPFCQRCTGFFAGAAVAVLLQILLRPRPSSRHLQVHGLFLLQMIPLGFHLIPQDGLLRTLSGQVFGLGVVAYLFLLPVSLRDCQERSTRRNAMVYWIGFSLSLLAIPALALQGGPLAAEALSWLGLAGLAALCVLVLVNGALSGPVILSLLRQRSGKRVPL